jgi:hypothetical protein
MEKQIGVIVGQFQVPSLEWCPGYKTLLKHVAHENDQVLVLLGESISTGQNSPLPFNHRQAMFAEEYPDIIVERIPDMPDDTAWVHYLDAVIRKKIVQLALQNAYPIRARLYGGREGFLATYYQHGGRYPTAPFPGKMNVGNVVNDIKRRIETEQRSSVDIRTGLVQAWEKTRQVA